MDVATGTPFGQRWNQPERPIPPGSLLKPFLAELANRETEYHCRPGECWLPQGHGRLNVSEAIAQSCNTWFVRFARTLPAGARERLRVPGAPSNVRELAGLGSGWKVSPLALMRAFISLIQAPSAALVRHGMALSARKGTGRLVNSDCFIKTGTAPCAHPRRAPGDGLAICLFPARDPKYVILVNVHGTTGSNAAKVAGEMIGTFSAR
jgi:cell division protein FtsI/penicillin-binding protein 2